jgi:hypothetical protein
MPPSDLERIFIALQASGCRYLVVGGVAVVLHGHLRFTADLDLVLALDRQNVETAIGSLRSLGYQPRAPVPFEQLANPAARQAWAEQKGMTVFSLWSSEIPATEVDVFVSEPFDFETAYARALRADLGDVIVTVASVADLVAMKQRAGRSVDREDIRALEAIEEERRRDGDD